MRTTWTMWLSMATTVAVLGYAFWPWSVAGFMVLVGALDVWASADGRSYDRFRRRLAEAAHVVHWDTFLAMLVLLIAMAYVEQRYPGFVWPWGALLYAVLFAAAAAWAVVDWRRRRGRA